MYTKLESAIVMDLERYLTDPNGELYMRHTYRGTVISIIKR